MLTIQEINNLGREEFVSKFGSLYERSPWVAERAWNARPFASLDDLRGAMVEAVRAAPEERKMALIRAHPDLAGKAAVAGELTRESEGEQASAGLDRLSADEYEAFASMNRDYREKFNFPMIVAVKRHGSKESILRNARERLGNSRETEIETALGEIHEIARLRLEDAIADAR
jgi:2-oxo-4-hydroxy-4-carboxy-5-ureidoimidazoline decarboxylase